MLKLVNHAPESKYVDLIVAFTEDGKSDEYDDLPAPPVRYYFGNWRPTSLRKPLTPLPPPTQPTTSLGQIYEQLKTMSSDHKHDE